MSGAVAASRLVHASIDGTIAIAVVALASVALARRAPALRCRLWWVACCKVLVGLAGIAPFTLSVLPAAVSQVVRVDGSLALPQFAAAAGPIVETRWPWQAIAMGLWAAGVLVAGAVIVNRYLKTRRILRRADRCASPATSALEVRLSRAVGLRRPPELLVSSDIASPQLVGALAPAILLPRAWLANRSDDELAMALCHELIHARRRDLGWGWVPAIAARLFFFHPGVLLAAREYALAREEACDVEVLRVLGVSPAQYGRFLLNLQGAARVALAPAVPASSTFLNLRRRLLMLEHAPDRPNRSALRWAAPALIAVAVLIPVRLAARSPHDREAAAVSSSADAYVLFLDATSVTMSGTMDDLAQARKLRDGRDGPTLWFRRGGKEFLVTDPATLRSIADIQRPEHERATEARQAQVAAEQAELEARLEALSRGRDEASEQTLKRALAADERRAGEASQLRAQAEMERELAAVSSRVDRLNSEQDVIAKEIERAAMEADRRIRILLEKRIESGAARHVGPEGGVEGGVKGGVKGGVEGGIEGGVDNGDDGGTDGSVEL